MTYTKVVNSRHMETKDCIFCKICEQKIPTDFLYRDREVVVFRDISPKAPVHLLIVPCRHIQSVNELTEKDSDLIAKMFFVAQKMAKREKVAKSGYKLIFNVGRGGGQMIDHLHLHLLAGKRFTE